ncbi:MAG TPA: hypothetical protein VK669_07150 [Candidatus Limnocylindrales bacterium]|nr:hypothetical protein [Candidatus Limnocylindrales bacterium]
MLMPGWISEALEREETRPICLSVFASVTVYVTAWSACTVIPLSVAASYPALETASVYVSGVSEMNVKLPALSVTVDAVPDGLVAVTFAPATGACEAASKTFPLSAPVVPANAAVMPPQRKAMLSTRVTTSREDVLRIRGSSRVLVVGL